MRAAKKILVIDDDEAFGNLTRLRLDKAGYQARFHRGPFGALHAIREAGCDLVMLDVTMPGLDGAQIVKLVREARGLEKTKLLLFSALDPEQLAEIGKQHRVPVAGKGSSWSTVLTAVDSILSTSN